MTPQQAKRPRMKGNDHSIVKKANKQLILNTISETGAMTKEDIVFQTRLSRPTVVNLLQELESEGLVDTAGSAPSTVGRSAQLFEVGTNRFFAVGVDLEYPTLRVVVLDLRLRRVYSHQSAFSAGDDAETVIAQLYAEIGAAIEAIQNDGREIVGICVGLPGLLDVRTNASLHIERIPGWHGIPVGEMLTERYGVPVVIRNDVHLMAQTHSWKDRDASDYVYISVRSGIGMAVFIGGTSFDGTMGNAGFIGHMTIQMDGELCRCGKRGCLETIFSEPALIGRYAALTSDRSREEPQTYAAILDRFAAGDTAAGTVLAEAYRAFGVAISNTLKLLDIPVIVINGLPLANRDVFVGWIRAGIQGAMLDAVFANVSIIAEDLDEDEKAMGAAMFVLRHYFVEPKLHLTPDAVRGEPVPGGFRFGVGLTPTAF